MTERGRKRWSRRRPGEAPEQPCRLPERRLRAGHQPAPRPRARHEPATRVNGYVGR